MKRLFMILSLVVLLCLSFSCQQADKGNEMSAVDVEADVAAIKRLSNQVIKAFNEGDIEAYMDTIAENAVFMPPNEPALIGKDAIRNWYDFDTLNFDMTITVDEIEVQGDWAFQRSHWKGDWIEHDTREKTKIESKTINIFRRQPDGSWKNSHSIWNFTSRETGKL